MTTTLWLVGCGQEAPPYNDLPLRDALRAAPEVVASLSYDTRRDLAQRLDAAALQSEGTTNLERPEVVTLDTLARLADETREEQGDDALIVGEIVLQPNDVVVRSAAIDDVALGRVTVGPLFLRGNPGAQTMALEDAALQGRAGTWLRELSGRTKTDKMVRTTGLPMGAWAFDDTLYVNASWLVAMSALEQNLAAAPGNDMATTAPAPKKTPLTVDFNPYKLPETIAECAAQVEQTCKCGTSCTHDVTDPAFSNANEECAWVNMDVSHPAALCILALMSVDDIRACMWSAGGQCPVISLTSRDDAVVFAQNATCMDLLDTCLRDGYIPRPSSSGSSNGCDGCSGCNPSLCSSNGNGSSCSDDCSKCNDDCSKCNDNVSECNQNCSDANQNAKTCGRCSVKPVESTPFPAPFRSAFWLVAPVAYVLSRGRRRS